MCEETGQNRKGAHGSKPLNKKEFKGILGLQKCPVCPLCASVIPKKFKIKKQNAEKPYFRKTIASYNNRTFEVKKVTQVP